MNIPSVERNELSHSAIHNPYLKLPELDRVMGVGKATMSIEVPMLVHKTCQCSVSINQSIE